MKKSVYKTMDVMDRVRSASVHAPVARNDTASPVKNIYGPVTLVANCGARQRRRISLVISNVPNAKPFIAQPVIQTPSPKSVPCATLHLAPGVFVLRRASNVKKFSA